MLIFKPFSCLKFYWLCLSSIFSSFPHSACISLSPSLSLSLALTPLLLAAVWNFPSRVSAAVLGGWKGRRHDEGLMLLYTKQCTQNWAIWMMDLPPCLPEQIQWKNTRQTQRHRDRWERDLHKRRGGGCAILQVITLDGAGLFFNVYTLFNVLIYEIKNIFIAIIYLFGGYSGWNL